MKIAVLLSGGVDSSVALRLLQEQGHTDLTAFYLKVWLEEELSFLGDCPWQEDLGLARAVCEQAGVDLEIVSLQKEYLDQVVGYTLEELRAGRTPSPDIFCNQRIKFGAFLDRLDGSFDRIASGHYARISEHEGRPRLHKGVDPIKDQTYFLSHLSSEQLGRSLFPIGHLPKSEVRRKAARFQLPNRDRRDSQGICFLGKIRFNDFVEAHLGERPGEILELKSDRVLGEHRGYWFHTIGQRKGLGLSQGPWFVVDKDLDRNVVYVSHQERLAASSRDSLRVTNLHWIEEPGARRELTVKLRHSEHVYECRLDGDGDSIGVTLLDGADSGIAAGQFAVFYDGDVCLGGGVIE